LTAADSTAALRTATVRHGGDSQQLVLAFYPDEDPADEVAEV
jgi:hypothetical protein